MRGPRVLVVDNRDSFVFNLVDDLARLGARPEVVRSQMEATDLDSCVAASGAELLVFSPGPGHPAEAGVMIPFLQARGSLPVLGVCLGMQAMVCALGGTVERAPRPVHGRSSRIRHWGDPVFEGVEDGFDAGRYHSLVATSLPDELESIADTGDLDSPLVMGVRHRRLPWVGLQFHPESILTPRGTTVLANILRSLT